MRVGYGYRRIEQDFEGTNVKSVYLDTPKSDREQRAAMFQVGLRRGDTLVLLGKGDLGYGLELKRLRERLEAMGVETEYVDAPKPAGSKPRGRPTVFDPEPDHDTEIQIAWYDEDRTVKYVLKLAKKRGYDIQVHHLKHRYGNRFTK